VQRTAKEEETAHWQAATPTATYLPGDTCVTHLITIYYFAMNRFWNRGVQVIREQSVMGKWQIHAAGACFGLAPPDLIVLIERLPFTCGGVRDDAQQHG